MPAVRSKLPHIALLALLATGISCSRTESGSQKAAHLASSKSEQNRKTAPDFTLGDAAGQKVKLSDYRGKVVLLNFWATWCGPCQVEMPWFEEFERDYKSKGFEVVGVSMDEDGWSVLKPYLAEHKLNYRILLGDDSVGQLYGGVDSLPTTFIIDREGKFAFPPHVGLAGKDEYSNEIQSLLDEKPTNASLASVYHPALAVLGAGQQALRSSR